LFSLAFNADVVFLGIFFAALFFGAAFLVFGFFLSSSLSLSQRAILGANYL
jgi:hypothetical protein